VKPLKQAISCNWTNYNNVQQSFSSLLATGLLISRFFLVVKVSRLFAQ